jgi:hypothetical protein
VDHFETSQSHTLTCLLRRVTALGASKIYLTYNDRLYRSYSNDWTYTINFCVNHAENNTAIIVACIPALRGLIMRWIGSSHSAAYNSSSRRAVQSPDQRQWPPDRIKKEWDITISTMTSNSRAMNDSFAETAIRSIGSDTTLGKETYVSIAEVERGYSMYGPCGMNPTMKEIDDMEFITVKSGILDRHSAERRSNESQSQDAILAIPSPATPTSLYQSSR